MSLVAAVIHINVHHSSIVGAGTSVGERLQQFWAGLSTRCIRCVSVLSASSENNLQVELVTINGASLITHACLC